MDIMKIVLISSASLALVACGESAAERADEICMKAIHGLGESNTGKSWGIWRSECREDVWDAEREARESAVQPYRNISRIEKGENATSTE